MQCNSTNLKVMEDQMRKYSVTVNLKHKDRGDVAVELEPDMGDSGELWHVAQAIGEDGKTVLLTKSEKNEAIKLAQLGVDETGR